MAPLVPRVNQSDEVTGREGFHTGMQKSASQDRSYGGQATSCEAGPDSVLELLPSSGPLCSETALGGWGWGLHSGIQGVTGQAD